MINKFQKNVIGQKIKLTANFTHQLYSNKEKLSE